ncbi:MAG: hypothetical protein AAGA80_27865 [Cyanobacteria bacterium P01_F01_bin.143]
MKKVNHLLKYFLIGFPILLFASGQNYSAQSNANVAEKEAAKATCNNKNFEEYPSLDIYTRYGNESVKNQAS